MKVLIAGVDGYIGWALAQYLILREHEIFGIDPLIRRTVVAEIGSQSATPIVSIQERLIAFQEIYGCALPFQKVDLTDYTATRALLHQIQPDAIVHLAEIPSAPYSMVDAKHAARVQHNNVIGTLNLLHAMMEACPQAHLLKLGTMGEYGSPNVEIPEGFFDIEFRGQHDRLPFPRQPGSWYHCSKVHDSHNIVFACQAWGLRCTDVMQGIVFGTHFENMSNDPRLLTRFDYDQFFGTVLNRFCAEAVIDHPLTVFGTGQQKKTFLPLKDSLQCLTLALENPPQQSEYRVFNQFQGVYDINTLATYTKEAAKLLGKTIQINYLKDPRNERLNMYYNPESKHLLNLGFKPTENIEAEILALLKILMPHRDRILKSTLLPDITWHPKHSQQIDKVEQIYSENIKTKTSEKQFEYA